MRMPTLTRSRLLALWLLMPSSGVFADGLTVSGGVDLRANFETREGAADAEAHGLFLNLRQVWSDATGDRWIAVAQGDWDDNFQHVEPYQAYLQYKGPLGKWNARAGHFLLPFGLLATYDTERLPLRGLEELSLGIRHDTGAQVLGRFGDWDYAVAVTGGLGTERFPDSRANPVLTARLARVQDDWQVGISALMGRVLVSAESFGADGFVDERRVAFDATRTLGAWTLRGEAVLGSDNDRLVGGGVVLADYALTPRLEINSRLAWWHRDGDRQFAGLGISYQLAPGLFARLADNYEFGKREHNELTTQLYFEFSRRF